MTDLRERLLSAANSFSCGDWGAGDVSGQDISDDIAALLRESSQALSGGVVLTTVCVALEDRVGGGLRAFSDELTGLVLSGNDKAAVEAKIPAAIRAIFKEAKGLDVTVHEAKPLAEIFSATTFEYNGPFRNKTFVVRTASPPTAGVGDDAVERAAKAMRDDYQKNRNPAVVKSWDKIDEGMRETWRQHARAALATRPQPETEGEWRDAAKDAPSDGEVVIIPLDGPHDEHGTATYSAGEFSLCCCGQTVEPGQWQRHPSNAPPSSHSQRGSE